MIRYWALLLAFAASPFLTKGQTNMHHEVGLGYGYLTKEQFHNGIFDLDKSYSGLSEQESIVSELYEGAGVKPYINDFKRSGVIAVSYKYSFSERISAGITIAAENEHTDVYVSSPKKVEGKYRRTAISVAAEAKFVYAAKGIVTVYGLAGFGNCFISQKITGNNKERTSSTTYFTLQLSPIGLRVGKKVGSFAEAGFGYKGICHLGVSYRF
jgi:hypothetical protein